MAGQEGVSHFRTSENARKMHAQRMHDSGCRAQRTALMQGRATVIAAGGVNKAGNMHAVRREKRTRFSPSNSRTATSRARKLAHRPAARECKQTPSSAGSATSRALVAAPRAERTVQHQKTNACKSERGSFKNLGVRTSFALHDALDWFEPLLAESHSCGSSRGSTPATMAGQPFVSHFRTSESAQTHAARSRARAVGQTAHTACTRQHQTRDWRERTFCCAAPCTGRRVRRRRACRRGICFHQK